MNKDFNAKEALFAAIESTRIGMLQSVKHWQAQPMSAFAEPEQTTLWFFTRKDTDLAQAVGADGEPGQFVLTSGDGATYASVRGVLRQDLDQERIEKFWGPMVAAWYPDGKSDPELTLLRLDLHEASVWVSSSNPFKVMWEIAKANRTGQEPDIGAHEEIKLQ